MLPARGTIEWECHCLSKKTKGTGICSPAIPPSAPEHTEIRQQPSANLASSLSSAVLLRAVHRRLLPALRTSPRRPHPYRAFAIATATSSVLSSSGSSCKPRRRFIKHLRARGWVKLAIRTSRLRQARALLGATAVGTFEAMQRAGGDGKLETLRVIETGKEELRYQFSCEESTLGYFRFCDTAGGIVSAVCACMWSCFSCASVVYA